MITPAALRNSGIVTLGALIGIGITLFSCGWSRYLPLDLPGLLLLGFCAPLPFMALLFSLRKKAASSRWQLLLGGSIGLGSLVTTIALSISLVYALFTLDTQYAAGYSEESFQQIELGDTREEVYERLGEPLRIYGLHDEVLSYSRSPWGSNYHVREVVLDSDSRVTEVRAYIWWD